jgi:hypothetical protein
VPRKQATNRPSNLRYTTRSDNILDSIVLGTKFGGNTQVYPFRNLDVGDSFQSNPVSRNSIMHTVSAARRRMGHAYSIPKAANDDGSWTVTRVA